MVGMTAVLEGRRYWGVVLNQRVVTCNNGFMSKKYSFARAESEKKFSSQTLKFPSQQSEIRKRQMENPECEESPTVEIKHCG